MKLIKNIFFIFCISFMFVLGVNAETGYTTEKTGISMRNQPSTSGSEVTLIPGYTEFYISNINAAPKGNGCRKQWYYIHYNGYEGYACSNIIQIKDEEVTYNTPWVTPKRAIYGGADFISSDYISKKQNTYYLKKFNVRSDGYYSQFNHQYMTDLLAPAKDSIETYKKLQNGYLEMAYNFYIPVYNEIDSVSRSYEYETKYDGLYSNFERGTINTLLDSDFENSIKDFPETYKPFLRYLKSKHSSWSFTPLFTGVTLDYATSVEQPICKYETTLKVSTNFCQDPSSTSRWCTGNYDITKYFLDPRNFLSERYIFMFLNLGYSDYVNEDLVKSVLKGTFMEGNSSIDNQSYSSIFMAAGKKYDVSPLYLAVTSKREVGNEISQATSGEAFTYTYKAFGGDYVSANFRSLYNFFNIGAYDSAGENAALAGLTWGFNAGGRNSSVNLDNYLSYIDDKDYDTINPDDINKGNITPTTPSNNDVQANTDFVSILQAGKTGEYLRGYALGTTVGSIKSKVGNSLSVVIKDSNGNVKGDNDPIGTGYTISVSNSGGSKTYTYVMYGDLNGDGEINSADLLKMRQYLLGQITLSGSFKVSAYLNGDGEINSADLLRIRQHLLGTSPIGQ